MPITMLFKLHQRPEFYLKMRENNFQLFKLASRFCLERVCPETTSTVVCIQDFQNETINYKLWNIQFTHEECI